MWNKLFPNYTRIIPERRIFDLAERLPNHELVTMHRPTEFAICKQTPPRQLLITLWTQQEGMTCENFTLVSSSRHAWNIGIETHWASIISTESSILHMGFSLVMWSMNAWSDIHHHLLLVWFSSGTIISAMYVWSRVLTSICIHIFIQETLSSIVRRYHYPLY
jgi:hypothetical protein